MIQNIYWKLSNKFHQNILKIQIYAQIVNVKFKSEARNVSPMSIRFNVLFNKSMEYYY